MAAFVLDPTLHWNATGFHMGSGRRYQIEARAIKDKEGRNYKDAGRVPCTPDGPSGLWRLYMNLIRDVRAAWHPARLVPLICRHKIKRLRVLRDRDGKEPHFLTVIGCIGKCDESELEKRAWIIGSRCVAVAYSTGELFTFSNDWPGDPDLSTEDQPYLNNTGAVELKISMADEQ